MGKLPAQDLKKLLGYIKQDPRLVVPPSPGFDSGVHLMDRDKYLVVSTDPCIGVPEGWFGWFLIHYVASDVALFGAKAEYCTINLLGPPSTEPTVFNGIMRQASSAAEELGVAIVTGHTGTYEGLSTMLGVCTAYGAVEKKKLITPGGVEPEDYIMCVKPIGLETVVNFTLTHKALAERLFGVQRTRELALLVTFQSCVKEALQLAQIDGVHAMHDATEGGIMAALNEMAEASKTGFKMKFEEMDIPEEVQTLHEFFHLSDEQLLSMSSTGTILAAVNSEAKDKVEETLRQNNIKAKCLGSFTKNKRRILVKNGRETSFPRKADDPYNTILSARLDSNACMRTRT